MSDGNSQISDWPQARWARILDRVELRQADIGLKFWGPPLWLEVTMTGPDSDRWPAIPERSESWNWQSIGICFEAETLFDQGANDDQLVVAVGRYTGKGTITATVTYNDVLTSPAALIRVTTIRGYPAEVAMATAK